MTHERLHNFPRLRDILKSSRPYLQYSTLYFIVNYITPYMDKWRLMVVVIRTSVPFQSFS